MAPDGLFLGTLTFQHISRLQTWPSTPQAVGGLGCFSMALTGFGNRGTALRFQSRGTSSGGQSVPSSACGVPGDRRRCPRGYRPCAFDGRPCEVPLRPDCPTQYGAAAGLVHGSDTLACDRLAVRLTFGLKGANAPLVSCVPPKPKTPVRPRAVPRAGLGAWSHSKWLPKGCYLRYRDPV
jgi:hypothetical protein